MVLSFFSKKTPAPVRERRSDQAAVRLQQAESPRTELSTLDFSRAGIADLDVDALEVQEVGAGIGAVFEEAAVLYANGDVLETETVLTQAIDDPTSVSGEGLWMMLLDLYRLTGQRQKFESRVLDFAVRFERSPPPWEDLSHQPAIKKTAAPSVPLINLTGVLSADMRSTFEQVVATGCRLGSIRFDAARLQGGDEAGCALFRKVLYKLAAERVKILLFNAEAAVNTLGSLIEPGKAERRETWLLLLELLQYTDDQERFEQFALDYAITFEESPPSWEGKAPLQEEKQTVVDEMEAFVRMEDSFSFEGELVGASQEMLRKFSAYAAERDDILVECGQLRRVDFVNAGTLFNVFAALKTQSKQVMIQNVNAMVAALFRVMGIDQVAQVTLRI